MLQQTTDGKGLSINKRIEVNDRFFLEALRSTGYDSYSALYELIDNSIDAGATKIQIFYDKSDLSLCILDNGCGMSKEKLFQSMDLGCDREYTQSDIGYFGVGMKSSCLNLIDVEEEEVNIILNTWNGIDAATSLTWQPNKNVRDIVLREINPEYNHPYTMIVISHIKRFSEGVLKKHLGTVFYPTLRNQTVQIIVNDDQVFGYDPLYRESKLSHVNFAEATVEAEKISITTCLIDQNQEKHPWDDRNSEKQWSYNKGGVYVIYGSRYVEVGGYMGIKNPDPWDSRTRIEFMIPKKLTETFAVKFNKTNGISSLENNKLDELKRKIREQFYWASQIRKKDNEAAHTEEELKELEKMRKELNKWAMEAKFNFLALNGEREKIKREQSEGGEENDKPTDPRDQQDPPPSDDKPPKKAKIVERKKFDIRYENLGGDADFWVSIIEKGVFVLIINKSHLFFTKIYSLMDYETKANVNKLIFTMAWTQYTMKMELENQEEKTDNSTYLENFWTNVSVKLKHLLLV